MQATASSTQARNAVEGNRARALIRFNTLLFHALTIASFLENSARGHHSVQAVSGTGADTTEWLSRVWQPRQEARARELRGYIEAVWPEFDWISAYGDFCRAREERLICPSGSTGEAGRDLQRCVVESQAAAFYRAIGNCADDRALRDLARAATADHARCFEFFRSCFSLHGSHRRVGFFAACQVVREVSRIARDTVVADAFFSLTAHWYGTPTVSQLGYQEFLRRMAPLITRHAHLGRLERLLFSPWSGRATPVAAPGGKAGNGNGMLPWAPLKRAA